MMLQNDGGHDDDDNSVEFWYLFMNLEIQKPSGQLRTSRGGSHELSMKQNRQLKSKISVTRLKGPIHSKLNCAV
jgi:hypothetical protein